MYIWLHVRYPLFLSYFNEFWNFSPNFRKLLRYHGKLSVEAEFPCGRKDRRTDEKGRQTEGHDEAIRNFSNTPTIQHQMRL